MQNLSKEELLKPEKRTAEMIVGYGLFTLFSTIGVAMIVVALFVELPVDKPKYTKYLSADKQKELRMEAAKQERERNNILLIAGTGLAALPSIGLAYFLKEESARKKERALLLEHGRFGTAIVSRCKVNENDEEWEQWVEMDVEIHLDGHEPYQTEAQASVRREKLTQVEPGRRLSVLAAPPVKGVHKGALKLLV